MTPDLWRSVGLTLELAFVTAVLLFLLGLPLAQFLNTSRWRGIAVLEAIVTLPIVLPPTVIGFYLLVLFAPQQPLGEAWLRITGTTLAFTLPGLVVGSIIYSLPFAVQPFQVALRSVPRDCIDAALACGASPFRVFLRVTLPLARRGILAGVTLAFAHTVGEFGVVLMLGGNIPGVTRVASIALFDEVQKLDYPAALALSAVLVVLSFAAILAVSLLQKKSAAD